MDVRFRLSHLQSSVIRLSVSQEEVERQNQPRQHVGRYIALTHSTASASDSNNHRGRVRSDSWDSRLNSDPDVNRNQSLELRKL